MIRLLLFIKLYDVSNKNVFFLVFLIESVIFAYII